MSKKIEELERRIRELEARPVHVPVYVGAPQQFFPPSYQPLLPVTAPWHPVWHDNNLPSTICIGGAPYTHNMSDSVTYNIND